MSAHRLRNLYRVIGLAFCLTASVVLLVSLAIVFQIRMANGWQQYAPLPDAGRPSKESSIVVFAPHADDETLGCGGLLATAQANGAKVRVVLMTNGDGFWYAAGRAYKTIRLTPDRLISFACRRQEETLSALKIKGIEASQVTFLGYPDRGLSPMWNNHWDSDTPYKSKTTGHTHSPYANSYTPRALHCGESVLSDVVSILKETKPTDIYIPHPLDNHPDHYATYCFIVAAMEQLRSEGADFIDSMDTHTYLVHRGDWPVPRGDHSDRPLSPPHAMATGDTEWESLELSPEIAQMKREAIKQYKTQTDVEKSFLMSFARANELFGKMPKRKVAVIEHGEMIVDGATDDWAGIPPVVVDAVGDYVVRGINKGGDVRAIYACTDRQNLYLRLDCVKNISKRVRYTVTLRGMSDTSATDFYTVTIRPGSKQATGTSAWAYKSNVIEMALPLSKIKPGKDLFVQVQTNIMDLTVDNTGWHGLEMEDRKVSKKAEPRKPGLKG